VNIVLIWCRSLTRFLCIHIIKFCTITNSNFVNSVVITWFFCHVLYWHLLLYICETWWKMESFISWDRKHLAFEIMIIVIWWVACAPRRCYSLEINNSMWEPCKFCSTLEGPFWIRLLIWLHLLFAGHIWHGIISSSSNIHISAHSFDKFFFTCSILNSLSCRCWFFSGTS